MDFKGLLEKGRGLVRKMNELGLPLPVVRDPKSGAGSVSLTLVVMASALVMLGIVGRWSKKLGSIDLDYAMQFLWTACGLYFGRKLSKKDGKVQALDEESKDG